MQNRNVMKAAEENKLRELDGSVKAQLIESGFDPDNTPEADLADIARHLQMKARIKILKKVQEEQNAVLRACVEKNEIEGVRKALLSGADPSDVGHGVGHRSSLLGFALSSGYVEIARLLLLSGANVIKIEKKSGFSLLKAVINGGGTRDVVQEVIGLLINAGADLAHDGHDDKIPLDYAVYCHRYHLVDALSAGGVLSYDYSAHAHYETSVEAFISHEVQALFNEKEVDRYKALLKRMNQEMKGLYGVRGNGLTRELIRNVFVKALGVFEKQLAGEQDRAVLKSEKSKLTFIAESFAIIQTRDAGKVKTAMKKLTNAISALDVRLEKSVLTGNPNTRHARAKGGEVLDANMQEMKVYKA